LLALLLSANCYAQEPPTPPAPEQPKIDAPPQVQVPVGRLASVLINSTGEWTKYTVVGADADVFREYDPSSEAIKLRLIGYQQGVTYLICYAGNPVGVTEPKVTKITFGDPPPPTPTPPGPNPPGPTPPTPTPNAVSVLIVDESSDYGKPEYRPYLNVLNSTSIRSYLNTHCAKVDGLPEWRRWDKDTDVSHESQKWQDAMKMPRDSLPWIYISNGTAGFGGPLPKTEADTLALLKKWGGD
jgi:hypothetical protein